MICWFSDTIMHPITLKYPLIPIINTHLKV